MPREALVQCRRIGNRFDGILEISALKGSSDIRFFKKYHFGGKIDRLRSSWESCPEYRLIGIRFDGILEFVYLKGRRWRSLFQEKSF